MNVLPNPKRFVFRSEKPIAIGRLQIQSIPNERRVAQALGNLESAVDQANADLVLSDIPKTVLHVTIDRAAAPHPEGYALTIIPGKISLIGGSAAGCFYALKTVEQLLNVRSFENGKPPSLTSCEVVDWPDFDTRGVLHDVTRGKVPLLSTLKLLADRLACLKINQLQLYIEHAFDFAFDSEICDAQNGLTPDEVRDLDRYCHDRFIDLVPAFANLGHMGRILSISRYRQLAEIEPEQSWEEMSWPQRARGLTLDCVNPKSWQLIRQIASEILRCFSSPLVNICGDEPWDLGKGKNKRLAFHRAIGEAYLLHIRRMADLVASCGRRVMFWSDVVRNHPDLFPLVPVNATVLHWGYDDRADYEATALFCERGLQTVVCPGTSGWKRILNAIGLAERNIRTFAQVADVYGATGLVNTDWGDHGHFNALACSWHGLALGATLAWDSNHPTGRAFDASFAQLGWGLSDQRSVALLRSAANVADHCETWRLFWQPLSNAIGDPTLPTIECAQACQEAATALRACLGANESDHAGAGLDRRELQCACRFTELFADKVIVANARRSGHSVPREIQARFGPALQSSTVEYAEIWSRRYKASGLEDIFRALDRVRTDME